ncbi:hypothetical protein [Kitasatospora sp. NPDC058478]|uniref:hypothetical protein n=1 Tax=unclassified Kitasatospora TaxID=2633591 RepID=UPI0036675661
MNLLAARFHAYQLLAAATARPDSEITDVDMSNPADGNGPWAITVTTTDGRRFRFTVTEDQDPGETPATLHHYRAGNRSLPLGTYTNPAAARQHAEDYARYRLAADSTRWEPADADPDQEQSLYIGHDGHESFTAITVTPVEVRDTYDPEAEE